MSRCNWKRIRILFTSAVFIGACLPTFALPLKENTKPVSMRELIQRYQQDEQTLEAKYADPLSPSCIHRLARFDADWTKQLQAIDFDSLDQEGKADYLLLKNHIVRNDHARTLADTQWKQVSSLLPFAPAVFELQDAKRDVERPDGQKTAAALTAMNAAIASRRKDLEALAKDDPQRPTRIAAWRAADDTDQLRGQLDSWFKFYDGYDPQFTWWTAEPYKKTDTALKDYAAFLREKMAGVAAGDKTTIVGTPIGREALIADLQDEMIPYTPEELIAMAREQLDWCKKQMIKASQEMGYGDDWHKALEAVKNTYVQPGDQPKLIYDLAIEGEKFAEKNNLVTIPDLAKETWRMDMMTPEQQLVNPFFTGGDTISVSYPTNTMTYEERMMSMRGNNPAFSHATVFHELIPGHWLQEFMNARYRPYRQLFYDGFWIEGNAFYWEMVYWDHGFDVTPQQRIGALFWRMHRCARIIFSLSFHLGKMTPEQAIDLLVNEVGHERDNAAAEVRRSFNGSYDPLYQCAYMLGALQFRALHHELVDSGKMTDRQYHDAILHEGTMPVAMLRAILTNEKLTPNFQSNWRFLNEIQPARTY
ncbi:MAG TPA: DUF885 family protein [Terracidiphilus sp.]|nr:DUF885 family protein [Terracidiphilus sp.]